MTDIFTVSRTVISRNKKEIIVLNRRLLLAVGKRTWRSSVVVKELRLLPNRSLLCVTGWYIGIGVWVVAIVGGDLRSYPSILVYFFK